MNQEADEYLVKHGFDQKTPLITRSSIVQLLAPLLADVEQLREELEGERLWIKEGKKLHDAQKDAIERLEDVARVWLETPSSLCGAWQYQYKNNQGGAISLAEAIKSAQRLCARVVVVYRDDITRETAEAAGGE